MASFRPPSRLERFFRGLVRYRWGIVAAYAALLVVSLLLVVRVPNDAGIDRLIVATDPDYLETRDFQRIFPEGEHVLLLAEAPDPFAPEVLARIESIERRLADVGSIETYSALELYRRTHPGFTVTPESADAFRRFCTGTDLLMRQGLVGKGFLGIPVELESGSPSERDAALASIDRAIEPFLGDLGPLSALRRIGGPYVDAYLEGETGRASAVYFPLFGLFVIALNLSLYRSKRTLAAFLITLAVSVSMAVGFAGLVGYSFTIVSSLVPLTVLVTATASLVYIHSRFTDHASEGHVDDHQAYALANKFTACTASLFATAVGFAALAVSRIRPIQEMGLWTAAGLVITWVVVFTLFPALQRILRTPTERARRIAGRRFLGLIDHIPAFSYRWRWWLVGSSTTLALCGAVALFGIPGYLEGMRLQTDALTYIDPDLPIHADTRRFEATGVGLARLEIAVATGEGGMLDAGLLRALEALCRELERDPRIGSVVGPTTPLRFMRYTSGRGDDLPDAPSEWTELAGDFEQLLLTEPSMRRFVDLNSLASARVRVVARSGDYAALQAIAATIRETWIRVSRDNASAAAASVRVLGEGLLEAKIAHDLVPTLVESFVLTALVIFLAFLVVFRSGVARVLAMIPSVFAILVMFLVMRVLGISLNVATILIASTVLGASENDQIHFFYHFQEGRRSGSAEQALRHALRVSGRAILFATLINAGGFLALAFSSLPPMRQFGIISASAFLLSMLADFTALPASLWILLGEKPDASMGEPPPAVPPEPLYGRSALTKNRSGSIKGCASRPEEVGRDENRRG